MAGLASAPRGADSLNTSPRLALSVGLNIRAPHLSGLTSGGYGSATSHLGLHALCCALVLSEVSSIQMSVAQDREQDWPLPSWFPTGPPAWLRQVHRERRETQEGTKA